MLTKSEINDIKIAVYRGLNPRAQIQKALLNRTYRYAADLRGDRLRTPVDKYVALTGIEIRWSEDTIYYNDPRLTPFVEAIMGKVYFRTAVMEKEVLKADPDWKLQHRYRVLFPWTLILVPADLDIPQLTGKTVSISAGHRKDGTGNIVEHYRAVAFLTDCEDSAVLLKMKYPNVILEAAPDQSHAAFAEILVKQSLRAAG